MQPAGGCRAWLGRAILLCGALLLAQSVGAQDATQKRALAFYVTSPGAAGGLAFDAAYQKILGDALGSRLDFQSEYIDIARFSEPGYPAALVDFLRYKYKQLPPDVVLATTEGARQFVERFRADLFPGVPVVFVDRVTASRPGPAMTGIRAPLDLAGTVDLALTIQPATRRVYVINGRSEFDRFYERLAREQLQRLAGRVTITYLTGLALADLERTVAHLPPDSIIYFLTFAEDGTGARFLSTAAFDRLAPLANAPIYSWTTIGIGRGIVGGRLFSNEVVAERSAELALRILRGEKADDIPVVAVDPYLSQLDWRQLRRFGISEALAPAGTAVLFREPSVWDRYKAYIVGAFALIFFQAALITGLLLQRARRRRLEMALRENQATLQASNRQISDLFGRLIAAQETERSRIARELHDDVSQRVAGLSLMISGLRQRLPDGPGEADLVETLMSMEQNTSALADEIRDVSHDLHPSLLQHAGLVKALTVHCAQFEKLHAIPVACSAADDVGPVDADTALCLYRIAQEALRNVAKHADAHHVSVELTRTADGVQLSIADDGKGFDLAGARRNGAGLGLVSIDERVRLLRGSVHIDAQPGGGVRVQVQIPHSQVPPLEHAASGATVVADEESAGRRSERRATVLLADDHPVMRDGLANLLKGQFDVVSEVGDGQQLVAEAMRLCPDVIVADISMPELSGFDALRVLRAKHNTAKFIFLTMHDDAQLAAEAVDAGASGYVLKHSVGKELVPAITHVLQNPLATIPFASRSARYAAQ